MKNHFFRKSTATVMALAISALAVPFNAYAGDQQQTGKTSDGYDYELWNQNYQGQASMQLGSNGGFSCSWSNIENALFRTGKKLGSTKSWQDYGGIQYQYDVDYTPKGNSYMCVYGWTEQPTVEYYIVEAWGDWRPPGSNNPKAKITVDGKSYDLFTSTRVNQPSIHGNETFEQYWSVRTTNDAAVNQKRNLKGVITVSDHFAAWEKAGMKMGKMYEVAFNIEGYRSSGEANVKKAQLNLGNITTGTGTQPVVTSPPKEADSNGYYFNTSFESDSDDWKGRGDASVDVVSSNYADGKKSLFVSGRNDNWNGAEIALDPSTYRSGETYSFGAAVMQDSESSTSMKMTLQYEDSTGEAHYDEVATADAESGKWTALGNPGFTIPSDASNMYLYIEAPDSLTDFYIDSAFAGIKGKSVSISSSASSQTVTTVAVTKTGQPTTTTKTNSSQGTGLKDRFSYYFKIGTSVSPNELNSGASFLKENYNSITPENELKPDSIIDQTACQQKGNNVNTQVNLSRAAQTLKFCEDNGISLRGHTFVWYSQTPDWFFRENFSTSGAYVSPQIMDQRLESFIKNTFDAIKTQYPKLDLYSYDVCNELFLNDGGGLRPASNSNWVKVYGDDSFVIKAFQYARKYAPANCKLYLNDYNEYIPAKTNDIYNMAMKLKELGVIDGIGMQSHLDTGYPDAKTYETALKKFLSTGLEVQITELDITCSDFSAQASLYESIFKLAMENSAKIPAVTIWGTQDNVSWRSSQNPLLFSQGYKPKPAYDKVVSLISTFPKPLDENPDAKSQNQTWGDANEDTNVDMSDAVIIMQSLANPSKYSLSDAGNANADVNLSGNGITNADALAVQKYLVGILESLPESYSDDWSFPDASKSNYQNNQGGGNNYIQYTQRTQDTTTTTNTYTVPVITESAASDEFKPFNYEANKQYKAAPDYYYNTCQQQGKVTKETYNGIRGSKTLNVYTPYNYDPSKKYNIFYLMHGGGENENTLFYQNDTMIQNLLDNMIMNGELEPLIVVTPTFNGNGSEAGNFYEELRQSVIPFVEGKYSTYAKSTSAADIAASRMHRAYGGFSMGAVSTWAVIQNDLDIVGYFMPLSGDHWQGQGAYGKAKSIADAVDKSGLKPNQYFIFAATGSNDIAYPNVNPQVDEMKKMSQFKFTSDFSQGNFYFMVAQGNEHWWGQVRNYVYDALPYFFHESGN